MKQIATGISILCALAFMFMAGMIWQKHYDAEKTYKAHWIEGPTEKGWRCVED